MSIKTTSASPSRQTIWRATATIPRRQPLSESTRADVCVIGGGISGLTTAYLLTREGKSVVLLDDGGLASGMTQLTTGHLVTAIDNRYYEIERMHGPGGARLAAESHAGAIDLIEKIATDEAIPCEFARVDGFLFLADDDVPGSINRELAAARQAGVRGVEMVSRAPFASFDTGPCLRFPNQGELHPLKYLDGVAKAIERNGGRLFTESHADMIEKGPALRVKVGPHVVTADAVVVATNVPITGLIGIHLKQAPYMTYVIGAAVPPGALERALYWDTGHPYHYLRLETISDRHGPREILIAGGEDHKSGQADDTDMRHARIERWTRQRVPEMGAVEFVWGGQVMETADGLAFIGRDPRDVENVFLVTGDSGMGLTHGSMAGVILTDLIMGRANPWADLYDPARKTLRAAGTMAREALNVAAQYADWFTGSEVDSVDSIPRDGGAVLRHGLTKIAVYRDERGELHRYSAVCPHLGCIVAWNAAEKSWDCPCHGSRFDRFGKLMNGPANRDLAPEEES